MDWGGIILHTADEDATWQPQASGTQGHLNSVAFVSPHAASAVSGGRTILHYGR